MRWKRTPAIIVKEKGGKVLGSVRIPLNSPDFSSFLLQAQSSKAKIIGLANAGLDTTNSIKQAAEFGIVKGGQKLAGAAVDPGRSSRPRARRRAGPGADRRLLLGPRRPEPRLRRPLLQAHRPDAEHDPGRHLFGDAAISEGGQGGRHQGLGCGGQEAEGIAGGRQFAQGGKVLENGRMVHDLYLFEVKKPPDSKKPWDYYKQLAVVPGDKAFPSAKDTGCPLTK